MKFVRKSPSRVREWQGSTASADARRRQPARRTPAPGGIASELRKHPKHGLKVLVLVDPWPRLLPGMSSLAPLAMGSSVGHMGSGTIQFTVRYRAFEIGVLKFAGDFSLRFQSVK